MSSDLQNKEIWLDRKLERRALLKKAAIGSAALAVLYVAPKFTSAGSRPAYASITGVPGKISIQFTNDDISGPWTGSGPYTITAELCNVSGWHPTSITNWDFSYVVVDGGACLDSVDLPVESTYSSLAQVCGACEPGVDPAEVCAAFPVVLNTNSGWDSGDCSKIKVRVTAKAGTSGETTLTVTLNQPVA